MNVRQASKLASRVPTGIAGLDDLIQGGFPRGTLILLAGSPGTGKTIASAHYLTARRILMRTVSTFLLQSEKNSSWII